MHRSIASSGLLVYEACTPGSVVSLRPVTYSLEITCVGSQ